MKGKLLLLGGAAGILWLISRAKSIKETIQFLEYTPGKIELKFEGLVPFLHVRLDIYNPNRTSVPVSGILGQIYYKGNMVASFANKEMVNITGNETSSVNMKLRLSIFNAAVALFTKDPSRVITVDGLIKTSLVDVPFGYSYNFATNVASKKTAAVTGNSSLRGRMTKQSKRFLNAFHPCTFKQTA